MTRKLIGLLVAVLVIGGAFFWGSSAVEAGSAGRSTAPVFVLPPSSPLVIVGTSSLVRNDNGISMTLQTTGLEPGSAYTVWWVVFNNPGACVGGCGADDLPINGGPAAVDGTAVFAAGHVIGPDGKGNFGGHIPEGRLGTDQIMTGDGILKDSRLAEVHLVVRTHGQAIPGLVDEQISSFNGGCPPNSCSNKQAAVHLP